MNCSQYSEHGNAKAPGIEVPISMQMLADEVID